ncbi:unnamed protein product [Angiostrongylus costaricensis]|uniref:Autophagy-related protein n=1 Tax=Angiostrongylus costaricensis TaxID=334426 RepID=A0A0R3PGC6_ANGCS|nr:unnamed protein product [Angiostrongylus costaricensis]
MWVVPDDFSYFRLGSAYSMLMFDFSTPSAVKVNSISQAVQGTAAAFILLPFIFLGRLQNSMIFSVLITTKSSNASESSSGGCDANRFSWCSAMPRVNMWLYYVALCLLFEITFAVDNVVLPTLFSKVIGPRRQVTFAPWNEVRNFGSFVEMSPCLNSSALYDYWGPRVIWQLQIAQLGFTLVLWLIFLRRLVPLEKFSRSAAVKRDNESANLKL